MVSICEREWVGNRVLWWNLYELTRLVPGVGSPAWGTFLGRWQGWELLSDLFIATVVRVIKSFLQA